MTTEITLAKRPGSVVRSYTARVRDHAAAMSRLQEQYFAGLKRLESNYFDGIRRITDAISSEAEQAASQNEQAIADEQENGV